MLCSLSPSVYYEGLQDKLAQVRDARAALNALREEHREKLRRAAEEAERQRQIQLAQKLEIMRQKKQEYLEMQRQLAIQRLQEQEKERQMRLEQQKHTIQMRAQMPAFSLPYSQMQSLPPNVAGGVVYPPAGPPSYPGTFSPAGSVEGSPMHGVYMNQPGQTSAGGPYQAMPADPNMAYMYQPAGTSGQPVAPGQAPPTTTPAYTNYQPTPTQGYQNVVSQAQSLPPMSQAPPTNGVAYMGYHQPYNMQNMMSALPGQDPNMPPQQSYMPGQQPMYQQMAPPGGPQQQSQQQQHPQAPPGSAEAQLISFD
ncbi:hepatocyte growth factor-regulated tyrosine kinase substrate-like [Pimephales promelas]|uniref:hepatocyte growth factor-regulated tyrosine kinase substrate-like n=1 Tax=Pimephales promelas TaxID=90988 RepID=UPI00195555BA|nr:hepatocyte growth factor-regulated tyrosine kinase substrate-like [Pimephales promelas]